MFNSKVYRKIFTGFLLPAILPVVVFAKKTENTAGMVVLNYERIEMQTDSISPNKHPDDKQSGKQTGHKGNKKPDIKEVPKSRRQLKPTEVKIKPVKIIKPKIIKKPLLKLIH